MYLKKLNVDHFGKFHNKDISLDKSVNVIYGSNETGKTTIHKFIEGILFGFFKQNTKKKLYSPEYEKYHPWTGHQYNGSILYNTNSIDYRIERNFIKGKDQIKLYNNLTGEDITEKAPYNNVTSLYEPADLHFGINKVVYKNTLSVGQLGVRTDKEFSGEIKEILVNMQERKSEDVSISKAVRTLSDKMSRIGTSKARKSPLGEIYSKIDELEKELYTSRHNYEQIFEIQTEINQLNMKKEQMLQEIKVIDDDIEIIKNEGYKKQYSEAEKINSNILKGEKKLIELEKYNAINDDLLEKVIETVNTIKNLEEETSKNKKELELVASEKNRLDGQIKELSVFKDKDDIVFEDLKVKYETYKGLKDRIVEKTRRSENIQEELDRIKDVDEDLNEDYYRFEELGKNEIKYANTPDLLNFKYVEYREAVKKQKQNLFFLVISMFVLFSGVVLGTIVEDLLFLIAVLGAGSFVIMYLFNRRSISNRKQKLSEYEKERRSYEEEKANTAFEMEKILKRNNVNDAIELKRKFMSYSTFVVRKADLLKEKKEIDEQIDIADLKIQEKEADLFSVFDLFHKDEEINDYKINDIDKKYKEYQKMKRESVHINGNMDKIQNNIEDRKSELHRARNILNQIFIDNNSKTFEEYKQSVEMKKRYTDLCNNIKSEKKLLEQVLNGSIIEEIKSRIREDLPTEKSKEYELENAELKKKEVLAKLSDLSIDISKLEERIKGIEKNNRRVVDIISDLEYNNMQKDVLGKKIRSYSIAIEAISELSARVRDSFAPKLNTEISNILRIMTSGKYDEIKVDQEMCIKVLDNEINKLIDIEDLSVGTIDQMYFALRFSILKLIKENDKLPLFLDDCFVNYDKQRLSEILKYIHAEAIRDERQIVLFTCHDREIESLKQAGLEFNLVTLEEVRVEQM